MALPLERYFIVRGMGHVKNWLILAEMLNLRWRLSRDCCPGGAFTKRIPDYEKWLKNKQIDVIGPVFNLSTAITWSWAEYTIPYSNMNAYKIVSILPKKGLNPNAIYTAFDPWTRFWMLLSLPVCSYVLYYLRKMTDSPDKATRIGDSI